MTRQPILTALSLWLLGGCASSPPSASTAAAPATAALEVDLEYLPDMAPIVPEEDGRGRLMGSGVGQVRGAAAGQIRWSLFEVQGETSCELQLLGVITTGAGEEVRVEAIGFGNRPAARSSRWDMTASAAFAAPPGSRSPLAGRVAAWVGTFDARTGRHHYRVHFPPRAGAGA